MDVILIAASWADGRAWDAEQDRRRGHRRTGHVLLITPGNTTALRGGRPHHVHATDAARALPEYGDLLAEARRAVDRWMNDPSLVA